MSSSLDHRIFPAKLLLFGEHVLLFGASALAVPVPKFGGRWAFRYSGSDQRNLSRQTASLPRQTAQSRLTSTDRHHNRLVQFAKSEALKFVGTIDTEGFASDLEAGLFFDSYIPTGYGLGSSGALCAAVYDRYGTEKTDDLAVLKGIFAGMESFFHGSSSGIDPLTSFVGAPILIQNKTEVQAASSITWGIDKPIVFLLDSKLPRRTGPLVEWFLEQSREPAFIKKLSSVYLPAHTATLSAWLSADADLFWPNLRRVSVFQFENFAPMIPQTVQGIWSKSFDRQDFTLKICGAGGGGFVLGFAKNIETAQALTEEFEILIPF